ncbi:MAG: Hpt domain-containing protein [Lentisphaerae bacterium]|nr:Hpt domain-containing protein [Lentisphaerota bacterium]
MDVNQTNDRSDPPIFDLALAMENTGNNPAFLKKLAAVFLGDFPGRHAMIVTAIETGNQEALVTLVHSVKGGAMTVGARALAQHALRMEQLARSGQKADFIELCGILKSKFEEFQAVLSRSPIIGASG